MRETALDFEAPAGFAGLEVLVRVSPVASPATQGSVSSVSFVYKYVNPSARMTSSRGNTNGGAFVNATVYGFPRLDLSILSFFMNY